MENKKMTMTEKKIYSISNEDFIKVIKKSESYYDVYRYFKVSYSTNARFLVKKRIEELNIDISHFSSHFYDRPSKGELYSIVKAAQSFTRAGQIYDVSSNIIRNWLKDYDLPYYIADYKNTDAEIVQLARTFGSYPKG